MKQSTSTLLVAVAAAVALAAASLGTARSVAPPQGTRTASINLKRVMDKLQERQEFEMQLNAKVRQFEAERSARLKKLEAAAKEVTAMPEGADRQARAEALELEKMEAEQWAMSVGSALDYESALMVRSIYRNMRSEAAKLAENEGYDYVVVDDGTEEITVSRDAKVSQMQQAMASLMSRRTLYASPANDLTDKLIVRMNNARAAADEAPAAPPAPAAGAGAK